MGINEPATSDRIALLPNQIQTDPAYNVRPWSRKHDDEKEMERIEELARSIEELGQQEDAKVIERRNGGVNFVLIDGHRRCRALCLANERRSANGQTLLSLWCRIDRTGENLLRKALASNGHRRAPTPMDLALLIERVKAENKWTGFKGAKLAAAYIGIDPATALQHERFLAAHPNIQEGLHTGALTVQQGLDLLACKPEKQVEVLEKMERRIEERRAHILEEVSEGPGTVEEKAEKYEKATRHIKPRHPDLVAAIRDTPNATIVPIPRGRSEILGWFLAQDTSANGTPEGSIRQFVNYFCEKWASGVEASNDATDHLQSLWEKMVLRANRGKARDTPEIAVAKKSATGRILRSDKGKAKTGAKVKKPPASKPKKASKKG